MPLSIAQITDLHLRSAIPGSSPFEDRHCRRMAELFPQAIRRARDLGAHVLAITGDLIDAPETPGSDPGSDPAIDPAYRSHCIEDYRLMRRMLEDSGLPWMVLPGNHDDEAAMWQVFDPQQNTLDQQGYRLIRFSDREHEGHVPQRVGVQRALFENALRDQHSPPQVHLQHYVLTPRIGHWYPHNYGDADDLVQRTGASSRVTLSLAGHYHKGSDLTRIGSTYFAIGKAFCVAPFHWTMYELTGSAVTMCEYTME